MKLFLYSTCMFMSGVEIMYGATSGDWSVLWNVVIMWGGYLAYAYFDFEQRSRKAS